MQSQFVTPLIGIGGTLLGVTVGALSTGFREWRRERRERYLIGTVIYQELWDQAQAVAICANHAISFNQLERISTEAEKLTHLGRNYLDHEIPAEPVVFRAFAGRLHMLGPHAGTLLTCYAAIEEAKRSTTKLPLVASVGVLDAQAQATEIYVIRSWARASRMTAEALDALQHQVRGPDGSQGPAALSGLIHNLRACEEGIMFRGSPTDRLAVLLLNDPEVQCV